MREACGLHRHCIELAVCDCHRSLSVGMAISKLCREIKKARTAVYFIH